MALRGKIGKRNRESERERMSQHGCVYVIDQLSTSDMGQLIKSFPSTKAEIMIGHGSKAITKQHWHVVEEQHRIIDKDTLIRTNALNTQLA